MTHQEHIARIVTAILGLPKETIREFCRGNPFSMLLRSFDEFTSIGAPLYKKDRGASHYKMSEAAFRSGCPASKLHGEHRIPLRVLKARLLECDGNYETVLGILTQNEVVLITREEQRLLDGSKGKLGLGIRSSMGPNGCCRLEHAGIRIAPSSISNHL